MLLCALILAWRVTFDDTVHFLAMAAAAIGAAALCPGLGLVPLYISCAGRRSLPPKMGEGDRPVPRPPAQLVRTVN